LSLDSGDRTYKIAIANPDNLSGVQNSNNPTLNPTYTSEEMEDMGADLSKQCCLYIHFNGVEKINASKCNSYLNNISINYILE
jgi:hypothetical protein